MYVIHSRTILAGTNCQQKKEKDLLDNLEVLPLRDTFLLLVALPSAPPCLTAGFGMGPGVSTTISVSHVMVSLITKYNASFLYLNNAGLNKSSND